MEIGMVRKINIDEEMQQSYLDYAMSVIVARALPDARDGLKPVHRRILYAMHDMGIRTGSPYKKSARIVGEVLGKYHPHGDMAVYEAMARMAQDFSMRYSLVDGQGNFGSMDGDSPAAMRYTEARLAPPAIQMLTDIQKNTVDFEANFDGTLSEPRVLPSSIPNLLVNGATGIAVGMATSIPPHNLGEVIDAIHYILDHWEKMDDITVEDLMHFIQGPDFPTGGIIIHAEGDENSMLSAYSTGRGRVTVQASARLEEMERGRTRIIVNELPYMTNKAALIERIASLVREEKLDGIADLRDESDRQGMRIVIELNKAADPKAVLNGLYKSTPMQSTFSLIMLALVADEPRLLSLKQCLRVFVEHRLEIIQRRSEFDLDHARQRAHVLEGLLVALKNLDEIINLIRRSPDVETARDRMMKHFKLSLIQAQAILDMPLRRLAALERKKIEEEYKEVTALIKELEALLRSPKKMRQVVYQELQEIKDTFGDKRRTVIAQVKEGESRSTLLTATDLNPEQATWLSVSADGLISRSPDDKQPRLSGRDAASLMIQANTHDTLYLVTDQGEAAAIPVHVIPEADGPENGIPVRRVSALRAEQKIATMFAISHQERQLASELNGDGQNGLVITVTRQGMVKKSSLGELPGPSAHTFTLVRVNEGDSLGWVRIQRGEKEILLMSESGMAIRFYLDEVRLMGLVAGGVMGIKLQNGDLVCGTELLPAPGEVFLVATDGSAKRVLSEQFSRQGRYGQGIIAWKLPARVKVAGMAVGKGTTRGILYLEKLAAKAIRLDDAPVMGRSARGQVVYELKDGDRVTGLLIPVEISKASSPKANGGEKKGSGTRQKPSSTEKSAAQTAERSKSSGTTPKPRAKTGSTSQTKSSGTTPKPRAKTGSSSQPKSTGTQKTVSPVKSTGEKASSTTSTGISKKTGTQTTTTKPASTKSSSGSGKKQPTPASKTKATTSGTKSGSKKKPTTSSES